MPSSKQQPALAARRRAIAKELKQQGWSNHQIADHLGVQPNTVGAWVRSSMSALPQNLTEQQLQALPSLLVQGPATYGDAERNWTRVLIAELIQQAFGVTLSEGGLDRILREIGWKLRPKVTCLQVWELKRQGQTPEQIATQLRVTLALVQQWLALSEQLAKRYTQKRPRTMNANEKFSIEQLQALARLILKPTAVYGLPGTTWTQKNIRALIYQTYGISFHLNHIPYLLRRMKQALLTPQ